MIVLNYIARGDIFNGVGLVGGAPGGAIYCLDTVRTSLPLVRCVMDALTMSPTPAVVMLQTPHILVFGGGFRIFCSLDRQTLLLL